jgi:hypothetical protein
LLSSTQRLVKLKMFIRYVTKDLFLTDNRQIFKPTITRSGILSMISEVITRLIKITQSVLTMKTIVIDPDKYVDTG